MISTGVPLGAPTPRKLLASKPGTNSPTVGVSGSASKRIAVVTASGRSVPALMYPIDAVIVPNITCICPPASGIVWAVGRKVKRWKVGDRRVSIPQWDPQNDDYMLR